MAKSSKVVSHLERREIRRRMARCVAAGTSPDEVARLFDRSLRTVILSCYECGVSLRKPRPASIPQPKQPRAKFVRFAGADWSKRDIELSVQFGVSRERVRQVRKAMGKERSSYYRETAKAIQLHKWLNANSHIARSMNPQQIASAAGVQFSWDGLRSALLRFGYYNPKRPGDTKWDRNAIESNTTKVQLPNVVGECWEWKGYRDPSGYGRLNNGYAHRQSYRQFIGEIPDGMFIMHHCDNPCCVNPKHLFIGSAADNGADSAAKGRRPSKLTRDQVAEIKRKLADGAVRYRLSLEYGVAQSTIKSIYTGRTHKYVEAQPAASAA